MPSHSGPAKTSVHSESTVGGTASLPDGVSFEYSSKSQSQRGSISPLIEELLSVESAARLPASPEHDNRPLKRQKRMAEPMNERPNTGRAAPGAHRASNGSSLISNPPTVCDVVHTPGLASANWADDPYDTSPLTIEYLNLYFAHVNQATYYMLPKDPFLRWVRECHTKALDDKMILYSLMAMGCRFSTHYDSIGHGKRLSQIARHAERSSFGRFTLQLAQARLILALLSLSLGNSSEAWDYYGLAVTAICGLKYNTEEGVTKQPRFEDGDYGLNREALAECRRRTFWSACVMDVSHLLESTDLLPVIDTLTAL